MPPSIVATAHAVRQATQVEFEHEIERLQVRSEGLGDCVIVKCTPFFNQLKVICLQLQVIYKSFAFSLFLRRKYPPSVHNYFGKLTM